ncbi:type I-E CRISPR-associated protein Cse1/CasA [Cryobacterium sp. TMS1-13-1]|uniref:type I-E CRISPR-associated protein Cse1/CasA n=1 Tax=Cryobacterium sp. TMS1-13-1 TaxID=1259220 RepID=UPI00106A2186|nr:type I-E CRISPR-associated protein Cse1/CasA [Cryobacterium sp. TMS1-13-1]
MTNRTALAETNRRVLNDGSSAITQQGNIRELAWLPVIDASGRRLVGLDELFTKAHLIERVDVRAPIEKAGVLRFLTTVTALIARAQGITKASAEAVTTGGFSPAAIAQALGSLDDRLWLIHETTPFMQEGRYVAATSSVKTAASIRSTSPGDSTKAWWGRPGDGFATGNLSFADAPAALMGFWFYSVNGNGAVVLDGSSLSMQGSAAGKVKAAGVRLWKVGENLAATLLMNTPQQWVKESGLPAWAQTLQTSGQLDALVAATITGNAALLLPGEVDGEVMFTGAHMGSVLRRGIPPTADDHAAVQAAKNRNKAAIAANRTLAVGEVPTPLETLPLLGVDALKASLVDAWRADPQIVLRKPDPKKRGPQKDEDIRALNDVNAGTSVLHNLRAWYLRAFNPEVPGRASILVREVFTTELFSIQLKQKGSYGELVGASWLSMPPGTVGGSPEVQAALTMFAEYAYEGVRSALYNAIRTVLHDDDFVAATHDCALARFSALADDVVSDVIEVSLRGEKFTSEHVRLWTAAAIEAFDEAVEPYVNARRLPDIAAARRNLIRVLNQTESEK